jgi:hypothetical protein
VIFWICENFGVKKFGLVKILELKMWNFATFEQIFGAIGK